MKRKQTKKESKLSLLADDMIVYKKDPKIPSIKFLKVIDHLSNVVGYTVNLQKLIAFLYTNNKHTEKNIMDTLPFTIASKTMKISRISLTKESKDLYNVNFTPLKEETEKDNRK